MPLHIEKPQPLMVGDKAYYSLTSYDPIKVEVTVPLVTDADVDFTINTMLARLGATRESLSDPAWLAENAPGANSEEEVRAAIRAQLELHNQEIAEDQKATLCIAELRNRLRQAVPRAKLEEALRAVESSFAQQLAEDGVDVDTFMRQSGITESMLAASLREQATQVAEQDAALDAYAREKKLAVTDDEVISMLGVPAEEADDFMKQVRAAGQLGNLRDTALHFKAIAAVVDECDCTYCHETEEEAKERMRQILQLMAERAAWEQALSEQEAEQKPDIGSGLHLV